MQRSVLKPVSVIDIYDYWNVSDDTTNSDGKNIFKFSFVLMEVFCFTMGVCDVWVYREKW